MTGDGGDSADELVLLTECGSTMEAAVVRGALEANDIFCYVQGENHRSLLGMLGAYIVVRVLVRRADLAAASELLQALRRDAENPGEEQLDDDRDPPELARVKTRPGE
jgi:hypothetical protein